jgi:hypothetical protein
VEDADIVAVAERVLGPRFPIKAGAHRLSCRGFRSEGHVLTAELALEAPDPGGEGTIPLVANAAARGEEGLEGLAAFLEGWASAVSTVLRAAAAADPELCPAIRAYDLAFPDPFGARDMESATTAADFEERLLAPGRIGDFLVPASAPLRAFLTRFDAATRAVFPIRNGRVELRLAEPGSNPSPISGEKYGSAEGPVVEATPDGVTVNIQLVTFDGTEMRDMKQQRVVFVTLRGAATQPERAIACLRGWAATLPRFFEKIQDDVDTMMPHDLVHSNALDLVKPITEHDFRQVFERRWKL